METSLFLEVLFLAENRMFSIYTSAVPAEKVYRNQKTGFAVPCYKKKQMDDMYPAGGFSVIGQLGKGRDEIGELSAGDKSETVYAVSKMPHASIKGYVQVGENEFLAVVKDVLLLWLLLLLLLLALAVGLGFGIHHAVTTGAEPDPTPAPGVIDENAILGEGEISIPDKIQTKGRQITVRGIPEMDLVAGQREQTFVFSNPEENPCYFKIEIALEDTGEVLYTSGLLPPGYSISQFNLNRALEAGEYKAVVHFYNYSFDKEQRPLNNMDIKTTIKAS